ncbi:MAG: Crp/Fnr family transcriptional regulator [Bacteroidota bacterium]
MKQISVKKGVILQYKGEFSDKVFFVESGLLRSYYIDERGKEHIFMFAPKGWIIADSFYPDQPCQLQIDALEDSILLKVKKTSTSDLDVHRLVKRIAVLQNRIIMLMSDSAAKRYDHFLETYPDIVQRVPQKMIASYLGITPEALSTIKRYKKLKR